MKKLIEINEYSLLKSNPLLVRYTKQAEDAITYANEIITNIQKNCPHPSATSTRGNKPLGSYEKGPLISKQCVECGLIFTKPKASEYKVCIICWGSMDDLGHEQRGEDRVHVYQCSLCRHKEEHT